MNVLILDGGPLDGRGAACRKIAAAVAGEARAKGHTVAALELDGLAIKPCQGCFACWLKHPGTCALKDDQEQVLRAMAKSDLQVWITPITFGGYAPALKKALDRFIPNILPFFTTRHGEAHHPPRYGRQRGLMVLGTLATADPEAESVFHHLVGRNALNLDSLLNESHIVLAGQESGIADRVGRWLRAAEEAK